MEQITAQKTPFLGLWTRRPESSNGPYQRYEDYINPDIYENLVLIDEAVAALSVALGFLTDQQLQYYTKNTPPGFIDSGTF